MTLLLFVLGLLIAAFACVSLYCRWMRRKSTVFDQPGKDEVAAEVAQPAKRAEAVVAAKTSFVSRIKRQIMRFAGDVVFLLSRVTGYIPSHGVRMFLYRHVFMMDLGPGTVIHFGLEVRSPWNFKCGRGCIIGDKAVLDARYGIEFGDYVNLSTGCWIWTLQHDVNSPTFGAEGQGGKVVVGRRAWLSSRTTILPRKTIAEGVVLAAGAVLTKDAATPFEIWGGVPAKRIGARNPELIYEFDGHGHRLFV